MALSQTELQQYLQNLQTTLQKMDTTDLSHVLARDWQQVTDTLEAQCPQFYAQLQNVISQVGLPQ